MKRHSRPLVSIILPCYNSSKTLNQCLISLTRQTYPFFEILAIDDGSKDKTQGILKEWSRKDSRINPFFLPHRGIVYALNFGIYVSRGKFICRMDSDDIAHIRRIEVQLNYLKKNSHIDLVGSQTVYMGNKEGYRNYVSWQNSLVTPKEIIKYQFLENPIPHPTFFFKKALIKKIGGYMEGPFPEDYEFLLRMFSKGFRAAKIPQKLLIWRDYPDRLSRKSFRCSKESFILLKSKFLAKWIEKSKLSLKLGIVGFGKNTKTAIHMLKAHGLNICSIYSLINKKHIHYKGIPVYSIKNIPSPGELFLLVFAGAINAAIKVEFLLKRKGYRPLRDFLLCG